MSVQIELPSVVIVSPTIVSASPPQTTTASSSVLIPSTPSDSSPSISVINSVFNRRLQQQRHRLSLLPRKHPQIMLSEPPPTISLTLTSGGRGVINNNIKSSSPTGSTKFISPAPHRREGLKLSFGRSISEPFGPQGVFQPPVLSSPSCSPSLHPSKRCRMELSPPSPVAPPTSLMTPSPSTTNLLRPPPPLMSTGSVSLPASPCCESSTLQRTLLLQKTTTIVPSGLAAKLETPSNNFLLLDCRPFIAYNVNHIRGAINVNCCDRFNRKRLQQGKATLADLATTKEGKELLKKRTWKEVVVYDDCSDSLEKLPVSHTLFLVMNALVEDHREPVMLLGGLRDFQVSHRPWCEDHLHGSAATTPLRTGMPTSPFLPDLPSPSDICKTKDIENHPATQVLPHLYLGNMRDASDASVLKSMGVRYVLNLTAKPPVYDLDSDIVYKQLQAADNGIQNLRQFFEESFQFIDLAKAEGSGILVHCHAGVSRSPTIAVAYLMKYYPITMAEAYKFVKMRRSIISPNLNFMGQLWEYEQGLQIEEGEDHRRQSPKEPLTLEMKEIKESLQRASMCYTPAYLPGGGSSCDVSSSPSSSSSSSVSSSYSDTCKAAAVAGGLSGAHQLPFRWSEHTSAVHQQPQEDAVTSGCSV